MIRFFFLNAFIAVISILFCLWGITISIFDSKGRIVHFYCASPWAKIILWVCGVRVKVTGLENIQTDRPAFYLTNHQSYFDIFALLANLPVDFKFIMKQELMRIPLLGIAMRRARYVGIERDNPREAVKSMRKAAERVKEGSSLIIFPEGTRSADGRLLPFKKGGFKLALKSGCDIVPVTIKDSHRIVTKGSLKINKGTVGLHFGKPISLKEYSSRDLKQLMDRVRDRMLFQLQ